MQSKRIIIYLGISIIVPMLTMYQLILSNTGILFPFDENNVWRRITQDLTCEENKKN